MADHTLSVKITANAAEFNNALKSMGSQFEEVTDKFSSLTKLGDGFKNKSISSIPLFLRTVWKISPS